MMLLICILSCFVPALVAEADSRAPPTVWRQLELENPSFFKAYNDRLAAKVPHRFFDPS